MPASLTISVANSPYSCSHMLINAPGGTEVYIERPTEAHQLSELVRRLKDYSDLPVRAVMLVRVEEDHIPDVTDNW
jgi:hypothetical protein